MEYNEFNQLTSKADSTMGFASGYGALSPPSLSPISYSYDLSGNLVSDSQGNTYAHNRENRLVESGDSAPKATMYVYDFSGRLLMSDYDGAGKKYYYDGINRLLTREKAGGAAPCWRTISANTLKDAPIGQVIAETTFEYGDQYCTSTPTMKRVWYEYDHIGNSLATVNEDANISIIDMTAFGKVQSGGHDGPRLTTKHYDATAGLYYFGARWYDPVAGRWMEVDPLPASNLYAFVSNEPVSRFDSDGKFDKKTCVICLLGCLVSNILQGGDDLGCMQQCFRWPMGPCSQQPPLQPNDSPTNCPLQNLGMRSVPNRQPNPKVPVRRPRGPGWTPIYSVPIDGTIIIPEFGPLPAFFPTGEPVGVPL